MSPRQPNKPNNFLDPNKHLLDLYDLPADFLSDEEQEDLLPILTSLKDDKERYEEIELIAQGAEKKIIRVHDHRLNREVAMARAADADTPQQQEQFLREALLEAHLAHPNIMPVFNIGLDAQGLPFFTMELASGDNLETLFKKKDAKDPTSHQDCSLDHLLTIYLKICDAIAYAHSLNVLHLDLKPANISIGPFGKVFVCDWGLARVSFTDKSRQPVTQGKLAGDFLNNLTLRGTLKGTPGYMAPEQTIANEKKTPQTDIYALGAILYQLLTNQLPVPGETGHEVMKNTREGKVIPLRQVRSNVKIPTGLAAVAMKALSLKPEDRYPNVETLQRDITLYLSGHPTTAARVDLPTRFSLLLRRHNRVASLLIFFLLFLTGLIGIYSVLLQQKKTALIASNRQALAAQTRAEYNLQRYKEQREESLELSTDLNISIDASTFTQHYEDPWKSLKVLNIALKGALEPEKKNQLLQQKILLLFVLQYFNEVGRCFDLIGEDVSHNEQMLKIRDLSQKYAERKARDHNALTLQDLTDLMRDTKEHTHRQALHIYRYYMLAHPDQPLEEYLPLLQVMLAKLNGGTTEKLRLTQQEQGLHLDLSGSKYLIFTLSPEGVPYLNLLGPLKLTSLDISHTSLLDLSELRGLRHLKELRMVGLQIAKPAALPSQLSRRGVERLIIDTEAYHEEVLTELRKHMEVIED